MAIKHRQSILPSSKFGVDNHLMTLHDLNLPKPHHN